MKLDFEAGPNRPNEKKLVCLKYIDESGKEVDREFLSPHFYLSVDGKDNLMIVEDFASGDVKKQDGEENE